MDKISSTIIIYGLSAHLIILLGRYYLVYKYAEINKNIQDIYHINKWLKLYMIGAFLTGFAWGLIFFFIGDLSAEYHFLLYAVIVGLAGAGLLTLGTVLPVYLSFMLPMFITTVVWLFLQNYTLYLAAAFLMLLGMLYYSFTSHRFAKNYRQVFIEKETSKVYLNVLETEHNSLMSSESINYKLKERMELALTGSNTSILDWNLTNNDFYLSPSWKEMLGYTDAELPNTILTWRERVHRDDKKNLFSSLRETKKEQKNYFENNHRLKHKNGHWVWILGRAQLLYDENGMAVRMVGTHADITEYQKVLEQSKELGKILEESVNEIYIFDRETLKFLYLNRGARDNTGYTLKEMLHMTPLDIKPEMTINDFSLIINPLKQNLKEKIFFQTVHKRKDGTTYPVDIFVQSTTYQGKSAYVAIIIDITRRKKAEAELLRQKDILDHQAHHDALTGLANRILFNDRLEQSLKKAKRNNTKIAVLFIDLDHFKEINDSLGHSVGDEILKIVTDRLSTAIRKEDSIARLGGDEFTIMMEGLKQGHNASLLAKKILEVLAQPITIEGHMLYISSSIGISIYPDDGSSVSNLLKYADAAMYKAKAEGRNNFQFYSSEMTKLAFERVVMESSLRTSLENEDFVVYYQPQVNAKSNTLTGMEALVRWNHSTMGIISPAKFIPLAEDTGLIVELDQFVMRTAMRQMAKWYGDGLNPGKLALNLSVKQLKQKDFIDILENMLAETKCRPEWIELEVTEGKIMHNPEEAIVILNQISDLGIELAIDDFGTGYSSLSYIKKLPIHKLKIDQSFIRDLPNDKEDAAITKAVISLTQNLNLNVIAEGVETKEQREFLLKNGCNYIQGYLYAKPMPAEEIEVIIREGINY